jgi:Bacteriocin-protection, YdeI or OmpD-Associated/Domain of unknown function (DUF1905)
MAKLEFHGKLVGMGPGRAWTCLKLPKFSSAKFGTRGMVRVIGKINGFPIRTSVQPSGKGTHVMMVNKLMQVGAKAGPGDRVRVVLKLDTKPRVVKVPADLLKAINASAKAKALFADITSRAREDWVQWIKEAKQAETRARRIALAVKLLEAGKRRHDQ